LFEEGTGGVFIKSNVPILEERGIFLKDKRFRELE